MKKLLRIIVGLAALAAAIGWTAEMTSVKDWCAPMAGMGDNAGTAESGGEQLFDVLFIGAIWFLPVSPYLCMAGGVFNLISGKSLEAAYVYSLLMLFLITIAMFAMAHAHRWLDLVAPANILIGALWAYSFRPRTGAP